jgi:opacity protein-like surface antigen
MALAVHAEAQSDPRGPVRTIVTPHLRVHYQAALDSLARQVAVIAERAYAQLAQELAPPSGRIDMLLTDNVDDSNGLAQIFPSNRVTIYAVPPVGMRELRFHDEWLPLVITHELAHIFHLDRARGLWRAGRWIFGRNPLLFPNAFLPSWVKEGLAVHYESTLTGSGRLVSTEFPGYLRAAVMDSAWVPSSRWSIATTRFPRGQAAYAYGSLLMHHGATQPTGSMRAFVDATASYPIPYLLSRASRLGFGKSFDEMYRDIGDSVARSAPSRAGDSAWTLVSTDGWYASAPRWLTPDSLVWSASNGREVTGMYTASARRGDGPARVAWRNSLDVNVAQGGEVIYGQIDRQDPYVIRSDLYRRDRVTGEEIRLTHGARLIMPDVRRDGAVVAVQLGADVSEVVRVSRDGVITALTIPRDGERWAEPRWSPDGAFIAAVQLLATGEQRVVVLDSTGALRVAVTGARGVFESPSFTPDGHRLVWSTDRSGRMQIETAPLRTDVIDTLQWREERAHITQASVVSTGVYEPSLSPDGRQVAALLFGSNGNYVAIAALDTAGPMARSQWYPRVNAVVRPAVRDSAQLVAAPSSPYRAWRQLVPRYWLPQVGEGRDGRMTIGASTSGVDILGRHAWSASALVQPGYRETDGHLSYRFAGLGIPLLEASLSQEWDGSYRNVSPTGATLGFVARRRRFASVASTWTRPRVRGTMNTTLGIRYEMRQFTAEVDSALGPANSLLRVGTHYPSIFLNGSVATARQAGRAVSFEEGFGLAHNTTYRWREDAPGATGSWRTVLNARGYIPVPLPGYSRHALALRATAGIADTKSGSDFSVGGVSGVSAELMPGVMIGDPSRSFPVRGVPPDLQRGIRALGGTVEYRAPLVMFSRVPSPFTLYTDRASLVVFSDAARAWCPSSLAAKNTVVCNRIGERDGWMASAGMELVLDVAVQYDTPYRVRIGGAAPYAAPVGVKRGGAFYVSLGGYF